MQATFITNSLGQLTDCTVLTSYHFTLIVRVLRQMPVNIDGAIAAVCGDIGLPPETADALFIISRVPGIAAQAQEEHKREAPMRQIDPKDYLYDGPAQRRIPEKRR
jgi:citrate synthase